MIRSYFSLPPRCIFFKFLEDTLPGLIQDTMPPQAAILGEFEDHYTQILWPTLNVALTTTRNSNIQLDFSQKPRKNTPPRVYTNICDYFENRMMQVDAGETWGRGAKPPRPHIPIFLIKSIRI